MDGRTTDKNNMNLYRVTHRNINELKFPSPLNFDTILFDSNLNCNLHCVYCHNQRDTKLVSEDDFIKFIDTQVESVKNFQIGCTMEPTMDKRMVKFATIVSKSKAKPTGFFRIQTNGMLLHHHNLDGLKEAGISYFTISLDTVDKDIHAELRGGSDINKILTNIKWLRTSWPSLNICLVCTVSSLNIYKLRDLFTFAVDAGINGIELRKMFYYPTSRIITNHDLMSRILLTNEEFLKECDSLVAEFKDKIYIFINDEERIAKQKLEQKTRIEQSLLG